MKKLPYILYALLAAFIVGLLVYDYLPDHAIESNHLTKSAIILAGIVLGILRTAGNTRKRVTNKKALYSSAYADFIGTAFSHNPKLEKIFYNAVDDYNRSRPAACANKLSKLRAECLNSQDRYALEFFLGLCMDDMMLYDKAIEHYMTAQHIRPHSTIASNMGICYDRMGQLEESVRCYEEAIQLDPKNPMPYNNLAQQCLRSGDYVPGMEYARQALTINANMAPALNAMTICCYMTGDLEGYEAYYRQAVSNGSDGAQLKAYIASLNAAME